ncbi:hypothetical protein [Haloarchaeobius sp. DT45]|uniref:hypothetical protein n=1 Tax=Haloarchaeobius sp. DT45 TaxID=3446116 RepID=UPI003F6CC863
MVFEKLTLFEIRMDGAKIGGGEGVDIPVEVERDVETASDASSSGAGRAVKLAVLSVVVSIAAATIARRLVGGEDESAEIELEDEAEELTA